MSDSSEDEDLSRFKEAVDSSFVKLIDESRGNAEKLADSVEIKKSERYLETSNHYNDVRVPDEMQRKILSKISAIITKNLEFVDVDIKVKKRKIKGGVKLFTDSENYMTCEEVKDTVTEIHNKEARKLKNRQRHKYCDSTITDEDKAKLVAVTGEYVMSKDETMCWKSRRKEKLFKYKSNGKSNILTAIE